MNVRHPASQPARLPARLAIRLASRRNNHRYVSKHRQRLRLQVAASLFEKGNFYRTEEMIQYQDREDRKGVMV